MAAKQIDRRGFLALLGAVVVSPAIPKRVYVFAPPTGWNVSDAGIWTYHYAYRSSVTGQVSDFWANPLTVQGVNNATFGISPDLVDVYRRLPGSDKYVLMGTYDHKTA